MTKEKSVPVVLRGTGSATSLLVFEHPLAGVQLVKGTIESGETVQDAAIRELAEESGIKGGSCVGDLGAWDSGHEEQRWHFRVIAVSTCLPESWLHRTQDDGGHDFRFFWHPLSAAPSRDWEPVYQRALAVLQARLLNPSIRTASS